MERGFSTPRKGGFSGVEKGVFYPRQILSMETFSLREVANQLGFERNEFFRSIWPACQEEFKKIWKNFETT